MIKAPSKLEATNKMGGGQIDKFMNIYLNFFGEIGQVVNSYTHEVDKMAFCYFGQATMDAIIFWCTWDLECK